MNENTTMLLLLAAAAYFVWVHNAPSTPTQTVATTPASQNQTAADVRTGLELAKSIFDAAAKAVASGGNGVSNG